ncbi:MAG: MgtC/SapB family protein [Vicinamibacterales bacterium]
MNADLLALLVATLGAAGIGVERQQSGHASGAGARFAGVRTFTLLGLVSGLAGTLAQSGQTWLAVALVAGPAALVVVAYARASQHDVDATTEVAAFVVLAAGVIAGLRFIATASAVLAVTVLLLVEKSRLHAMVARVDDVEMRAAARFGVMAVVVLPLLPEGPFGPLDGIRPRGLWLLVLFFTGLSFIGYLARRIAGAAHGYPLTGALAGIVSSTNATVTFARLSRAGQAPAITLATGTVAACTVLFPRVLIASAVLDARVAVALLPYLLPPFLLGVLTITLWLRGDDDEGEPGDASVNPLQVWPALQMAATFQVVLFGVALVRDWLGAGALLATGAVLGLTDVDALTLSMAGGVAGGIPVDTAATAIVVGILANSVMKAGIALIVGTREYGQRTGGTLAAMGLLLGGVLVVLR